MSRAIIFDFDGTLADTVPTIRETYKEIAKKRGLPQIDETTFLRLRKGSVKDVIKFVGIRPWQLPGAINQGRKIFAEKADQIHLFSGVDQLIEKLHKNDVQLYILSSNSESTITKILRRYNLDDKITVLKTSPIFGKSTSIKKLIKTGGYKNTDVFMVGDEVRDIEAGQKVGAKTVAVTWGLQDPTSLKAQKPDHLAKKIQDLSKILF